jgi:hypothetical protein
LLIVLSAKADTVDELMRQLRAKGVLTEQEYNTIATKPDAVDALMRQPAILILTISPCF